SSSGILQFCLDIYVGILPVCVAPCACSFIAEQCWLLPTHRGDLPSWDHRQCKLARLDVESSRRRSSGLRRRVCCNGTGDLKHGARSEWLGPRVGGVADGRRHEWTTIPPT